MQKSQGTKLFFIKSLTLSTLVFGLSMVFSGQFSGLGIINAQASESQATAATSSTTSVSSDVKPFADFSLEPIVRSGTVVTVDGDISHDIFVAGETVEITGSVDGDAYVFAQTVKVSGTISGTLITAAQTVQIDGTVGNSLAVGAQTVIVNGTIENSIFGGAQDITISDASSVGGSLTLAAESATINTDIKGSVMAAADKITLNALFSGPVKLASDNITLGSDAVLTSRLDYLSQRSIVNNSKISEVGVIQRYLPEEAQMKKMGKYDREPGEGRLAKGFIGAHVAFAVINFVIMALVGAVLLKVAPSFLKNAHLTLVKAPFVVFAKGFAAVIVLPIIAIMLMVTLVGFPLGLITLAGWFTLVYLSSIPVALALGVIVAKQFNQKTKAYPLFELLTGLLILTLVGLVPVLNFFVGALVLFFGVGMWLPSHISGSKK